MEWSTNLVIEGKNKDFVTIQVKKQCNETISIFEINYKQ